MILEQLDNKWWWQCMRTKSDRNWLRGYAEYSITRAERTLRHAELALGKAAADESWKEIISCVQILGAIDGYEQGKKEMVKTSDILEEIERCIKNAGLCEGQE